MIELWEDVHVVHLDGVNVYVVVDDGALTLIGAGQRGTSAQLVEVLREHGFAPHDVRRVIANSWSPDCLGGAREFPRADLLVLSPDMQAPRGWAEWLRSRRDQVAELGAAILAHDSRWSQDELDDYLADNYPRGAAALDFIPIRVGQKVAAGRLMLDVIDASPVAEGACFLHCEQHNALFVGELRLDGLPRVRDTVEAYFTAVDRASQLAPEWVLPLHDVPTARGGWALRLASKFSSNYLSNAATMLMRPRSLYDIVEADLGPVTLGVMIEGVLSHRPFLEELVKMGVVAAEGDGLQRAYRAR